MSSYFYSTSYLPYLQLRVTDSILFLGLLIDTNSIQKIH